MYYPPFLKEKDLIGITAPSSGVGDKLEHFERALKTLHEAGFKTLETKHVRSKGLTSASAKVRAKELKELSEDERVKLILSASGGDFLMEMLPLVDWDSLVNNPKWLCGYSDPSTLLFVLPTIYDIATLYGANVGIFDREIEDGAKELALSFLKGDLLKQKSYQRYYIGFGEDRPSEKVKWLTPHGEVNLKGRFIGGCIDALRDIIGTPLDKANSFTKRYQREGIIWFFDNFALRAEDFYHTLWQMQQAGWFENAKAILLGRVCFSGTLIDFTYLEALERVFGKEMPLIMEMDIGHVDPCFMLINGGYGHIKTNKGKGELSFSLK